MHRHHTPRLAVATATFLVAALTACGGGADSDAGDSAAGGTESFCSALAALGDIESDIENPDPFVEGLVRVEDAAPDEIADDASTVRQVVERSGEISKLDAEDQVAAIEEFGTLQAGFEAATKNVEDYARLNCPDLGASFFNS
jgi:hypothetical protein